MLRARMLTGLGLVLSYVVQAPVGAATPLGSGFTYQGNLRDGGQPAVGSFDLTFALFGSEAGSDAIGSPVVLAAVSVVDGLFTVELDFGVAAFDGDARWLEIAVNGTTLSPRQAVTAAPYAMQTRGIYVNAAGEVGIGTTAPTADLHVSNLLGTETLVRLESAVLTEKTGETGSPSTAGPANDFLPFANVMASDNLYATVSVPPNATRQFEATGFGFNLPEDAVISGIEVRIERKDSGIGSLGDDSIVLLGGSGSSDDLSEGHNWNFLDEVESYGADNDLWGLSWSPEQINDPAFGVLLAATNDNSFLSATGSIDHVEIEVFYSVVDVQTHQADLRFDLDGLHVDFSSGELESLSVGGQIESATGGFKFPDGTIQTSASTAIGLWEQAGNDIFYDAGSVGIGTDDPTMPISIRGQASGIPGLDNLISLRNSADVDQWSIVIDAELLAFQDQTESVKFSLSPTGATVGGTLSTNVLEILGGSDIAEPFEVNHDHAQPGMVVCIDPDRVGELRLSSSAYDTTVAGIISGANGVNPGMTLRQPGTAADGKHPVAMTGRVWCWCDADGGPIKPGDLLTTSDTLGHAMKAADRTRAGGAVIGKAMSSLESGRGLVLVLVNLQ